MTIDEINKILYLLEIEDYGKLKEHLLRNKEKQQERKDKKDKVKKEKTDRKKAGGVSKAEEREIKKSTAIAEEYRATLITNQTEAEKKTKIILKLLKIEYTFQKIFFYKNQEGFTRFYFADFYLPKYNMILEVDGGYHNTREQKIEDSKRTAILKVINKVKGVIRIKNEEVDNTDYISNKLKRLLEI